MRASFLFKLIKEKFGSRLFTGIETQSFFFEVTQSRDNDRSKTRKLVDMMCCDVLLWVCYWVWLCVAMCCSELLLRLCRNKFKNTAFDKHSQTYQHIMISWYNTHSTQLCIYNPQQTLRIKGIPPMQWQKGDKPHKNGGDAGVTQLDDITYTLSHFFTKTTREHSGWSQWDLNPHTPANQENISS